MKIAAPGLVTKSALRKAVEDGYLIEVVCREAAEHKLNTWYGSWAIRAVSQDGTIEKLLVTHRETRSDEVEVRQFKTVVGLISFLVDLGLPSATIPLRVGGRALQQCPDGKPISEAD